LYLRSYIMPVVWFSNYLGEPAPSLKYFPVGGSSIQSETITWRKIEAAQRAFPEADVRQIFRLWLAFFILDQSTPAWRMLCVRA